MKSVGVYEAKTHLPKLLDQVIAGETIEITRHGKPVARLVPPEAPKRSVDQVIDELKKFPKAKLPKGMTIKDLINEGRI